MRIAVVSILALCSSGCSLFGPSCLDRQQRGTGASIAGEIAPGQIVSHRVAYSTEGSQNDVQISWTGQDTPGGPRLAVYATKVGCTAFSLPLTGECASIGTRGGTSPTGSAADFVQRSISITNGRGNPDILGSPAEYTLWVVGDPAQRASYSLTVTWFYGPDC